MSSDKLVQQQVVTVVKKKVIDDLSYVLALILDKQAAMPAASKFRAPKACLLERVMEMELSELACKRDDLGGLLILLYTMEPPQNADEQAFSDAGRPSEELQLPTPSTASDRRADGYRQTIPSVSGELT